MLTQLDAKRRKMESDVVFGLYDFDVSLVDEPDGSELEFKKNQKMIILDRDDPD